MSKITIKDIEKAYQSELSLDLLKQDGYEAGDGGDGVNKIINSLELELVIKKLNPKQREILKLISEGYTHREVAKMVLCGIVTVRRTLDKIAELLK